jgi:hypothetical protein
VLLICWGLAVAPRHRSASQDLIEKQVTYVDGYMPRQWISDSVMFGGTTFTILRYRDRYFTVSKDTHLVVQTTELDPDGWLSVNAARRDAPGGPCGASVPCV